jgi:hypothetical protein
LSGTNTPSKTNFLGVIIDTENGSNNPKINKALNRSYKLLDIMEFVKVTKFKLNMTMFDYFWQVVVGQVTGVPWYKKLKFITVNNTIIKYLL